MYLAFLIAPLAATPAPTQATGSETSQTVCEDLLQDLFADDDDDNDRNDDDLLSDPVPNFDAATRQEEADEIAEDMSLFDLEQIAEIEECMKRSLTLPGMAYVPKPGVKLDAPPKEIKDKFSCVLGSGFHACHRFLVPAKHCYRKGFCVGMSEALYCWNEEKLQIVNEKLKAIVGLRDDQLVVWRYFKRRFFARRCERNALPPSRLYWRVRAVFEEFGNKIDPDTNKPLFNDNCWKVANNLLKEILEGYYSDPPGMQFYKYELTETGEIKYDRRLNLPLLRCDRDSNIVENSHKNLTRTFGSHKVGLIYSDALGGERRHRTNIRASRQNRLGYPDIGHFDTWLIDILQKLVQDNHDIQAFPGWVNSSDFAPTSEKFGFVDLAPPDLREELITIEPQNMPKLTRDLKFLSDAVGLPCLPLPWHTLEERKLFRRLLQDIMEELGSVSDERIATELTSRVLKYIDHKVFPKLDVHSRLYLKQFRKNTTRKAAMDESVNERRNCQLINSLTSVQNSTTTESPPTMSENQNQSPSDSDPAQHNQTPATNDNSQQEEPGPLNIQQTPATNDNTQQQEAGAPSETTQHYVNNNFGMIQTQVPTMGSRLPTIASSNFRLPWHAIQHQTAAGHSMVHLPTIPLPATRRGRTADNGPRKPRHCRLCKNTQDVCDGAKAGRLKAGLDRRMCTVLNKQI